VRIVDEPTNGRTPESEVAMPDYDQPKQSEGCGLTDSGSSGFIEPEYGNDVFRSKSTENQAAISPTALQTTNK
jgi:hypothetical protein